MLRYKAMKKADPLKTLAPKLSAAVDRKGGYPDLADQAMASARGLVDLVNRLQLDGSEYDVRSDYLDDRSRPVSVPRSLRHIHGRYVSTPATDRGTNQPDDPSRCKNGSLDDG